MKERLKIYKHLMNGFSYMIPFVVAGGLLIAISSFNLLRNTFPYLNDVGTLVLEYSYPVLSLFIAYSIADRKAIVPGVVAGALALLGDSGFIGAILGGFLAGYLMELIKWLFKRLPKSLSGLKPMLIFPFLGVLFILFIMMGVNIIISPFSIWLVETMIHLDGVLLLITSIILGALMAVDFGGPVNKIAYMVGVVSIVHGNHSILMASIMVAGMIPPLSLALSTFLFKNDFTEAERKIGKNNWMSGLSFTTEGAIPFVKSYQYKVHIPLILGSILSTIIVVLFKTSVPAPHGGIFVIFFMTSWWGFMIALLSGTIFSSLLIKIIFILGEKNERT